METLVLDAMDPEMLVLDDGAFVTRLVPESDLRMDEVGAVGDGRAAETDFADASLEELLEHADTTALVLSSDVLEDSEHALELLGQDGEAPSSESELDELLLRPSSLPLPPSPPPHLIPLRQTRPVLPPKPASDADLGGDSTSSGDSVPKAAPPRRRRQKDELDYLRNKAVELEQELQRLKTREELGDPDSDKSVSLDSSGAWSSHQGAEISPSGSSKKKLLWRRVARSQLESRRRVQRENEKLKEMVQSQLEVIQGLEKVLQKRAAMEGTEQWLEDRKRARVVNESDAAIFEKLKMDLDVRYEQTASVFEGNAYAAQRLDGDHVQVKVDGADGMFLEFVASKIVPFDLTETSNMLWHCFTRGQMELKDGYYSIVDNTDDTLLAKMVLTVRQNNHDVLRDAKFVVRQYLAENQYVLVWACQAETEGTLTKANGVQMFDFGWTRVEPAPKSSSQDGEDELSSTIIQSCARVKIKLPDALEHTQEDVIFLIDLVTGSYMRNLVGIHQGVEDMLVEDAIKRAE